jgi:hypothetical protein
MRDVTNIDFNQYWDYIQGYDNDGGNYRRGYDFTNCGAGLL